MRTLAELKTALNLQAEDEVFIDYLQETGRRGIITLAEGDIIRDAAGIRVSDAFFLRCCKTWGVSPEGGGG